LVSAPAASEHLLAGRRACLVVDPAGNVPALAAWIQGMKVSDWVKNAFAMWPNELQRTRLGGEYAALRQSQLLLADLCQRNHVFRPAPNSESLFTAGVAEGRRRCVLELLQLTRIDPMALTEVRRMREGHSDAA